MKTCMLLIIGIVLSLTLTAIPKYDEGRLQLKGIQLLQDHEDANAYYYIPKYPRMATREDGTYEFMFMKYVGKGKGANGGLFHALIEFTLPNDEVNKLQDTLRIVLKNKNAMIVGPVPLEQVKDGEKGLGSFQLVSSILNNTTGTNPFTQSIITSGHAPFQPGSKAAVAACLSEEGATLLWESLTGKTSDVSVTLSGNYEAYVKAYNATVTAEVSTVYEHYSKLSNFQEGYTRDQVRKITDELVQNQALKIESFDRTGSLGVKADELKAILSLVTDKLIELMFDTKTGWAKTPDRETAVEADQIKGRQERGYFWQVFGGEDDSPYYSDNQFVLKKRTDIRSNKFYLNLSQATTIKVPVYSSGNLAGVYNIMQEDPESLDAYFKVVNMDDADFQKREVAFMLDGEFAESFNDIFNFVTVSFRKRFTAEHNDVTADVLFTRANIEATSGSVPQAVTYPRLGIASSDDWLQYEYKVNWNLKGTNFSIKDPANDEQWNQASASGVNLIPPLARKKISIEVDPSAFSATTDTTTTATVVIKFLVVLGGDPTIQRTLKLRAKDPTNIHEVTLFHDPKEAVAYQVTRFTPQGEIRGKLKELKDDFIMVGESEIRD
ncbi:MAG TPA: hypothetical protein VD884_20115 [Ohtaekwangia sp.]|nr:hypothetical protein [Ohtaekwangia sp.]